MGEARRSLQFGTIFLAGILACGGSQARAEDRIGDTVGLTPAATGTVTPVLRVGGPVFRDETVRTGPSGMLELRFLDETSLALGPASSVVLDEFVYRGGSAATMAVSLGRGAFRFVTGRSARKAYRIRTPLATVGVRGTNFTAEIMAGQERITIWHGAIQVCLRNAPKTCTVLSRPGQSVLIRSDGRFTPAAPFNFALNCANAGAGRTLCTPYGNSGPQRGGGEGKTGPSMGGPAPSRSNRSNF